ncbi:MAG: hypothetical protein ABIQ56_02055, partial [Chitinophagaceae bacterium]
IENNISPGESGIQAYVGCSGNIIQNNLINCNCNYGVYIGVTSSANIIMNNEVYGFVRAGIAIESDWHDYSVLLTLGAIYSRPNSEDPSINWPSTQWPFADCDNNIISNNVIGAGYSTETAAIYLAALLGYRGASPDPAYSVNGTVITDNMVTTASMDHHCYIFTEEGADVTTITMNNNNFITNDASKFYFTSGRSHFFELENNSVINNGVRTITGITPDVSVGKIFICFNDPNTTAITNFVNGKEAQEIIIRLDVTTSIVHNGTNIILKGGVNASGNANNFITLLYLNGIWFELNRNF